MVNVTGLLTAMPVDLFVGDVEDNLNELAP
jgi:hypothetical protein